MDEDAHVQVLPESTGREQYVCDSVELRLVRCSKLNFDVILTPCVRWV